MPSNHLKINVIVPELAATSTNCLKMSNSLLRDIIECLHLLQIVPDFTQIAKTRRQLAPKFLESPRNATQRLESSPFVIHPTQINSNHLKTAPTRPRSSEFHFKTSTNRFQLSCLATNSSQHAPKSSQHFSHSSPIARFRPQTSPYASGHHKLSQNQAK